jgi:UDP-N-acetylglucosamine:LPS N-acetylglucosamine transferase
MKLCLACSAGGHLSEMMQLEEFYRKHKHFFLTFRRADSASLAKKERVYFVACPRRNPVKFLLNFFQSLFVFLREKPDVVISTGADVAVSMCYIARLFGRKVIYIESFCRPYKPSVSGRLVYPIANLFIVQWKAVQKFYPKAIYGGSIF